MDISHNNKLYQYDEELKHTHGKYIVGIDEVGRGAISGPICAAAVILPNTYFNPLIKDSKKLSEKQRRGLCIEIISNCIFYSYQEIFPLEIDKYGLSWANKEVISRAGLDVADKLKNVLASDVDMYVIDQSPKTNLKPHIMLEKGENISYSIAAASIIAKAKRDEYMNNLALEYPKYQLDIHKGYVTPLHKQLIKEFGLVEGLHRFSYKLKEKL